MGEFGEAKKAWRSCLGPDVSADAVERIARASSPVRVLAKKTLVDQDDEGGLVYLMIGGRLKAVRYSKTGHEIWLSEFRAGDMVGEIASLTDQKRSSALVAQDACRLLSVPEPVFRSLMQTEANFATAIARLLAHRLVNTSRKLAELMGDPVVMRLYSELVRLGEPDENDPEHLVVPKGYSITRIGERIHATREATSRALSTLEDRGMASRSGTTITVFVPAEEDA